MPTDAYSVGDKVQGKARRCAVCGRFIGMLEWLPPYNVELEVEGKEFSDVVDAGYEPLISERLKNLCESHGITGFRETSLVRVVRARKMPGSTADLATIPKYYITKIDTSRAAVDQATSGFVTTKGSWTCEECRSWHGVIKRIDRLVIEPGTWQGEDIFRPRGLTGTKLVTQRFYSLCEQHKITGVRFVAAEEYWLDFSTGGTA